MGHATAYEHLKPSVAFTTGTYSHIISGMQEDMTALLDDVIPVTARRQTLSNAGVLIVMPGWRNWQTQRT